MILRSFVKVLWSLRSALDYQSRRSWLPTTHAVTGRAECPVKDGSILVPTSWASTPFCLEQKVSKPWCWAVSLHAALLIFQIGRNSSCVLRELFWHVNRCLQRWAETANIIYGNAYICVTYYSISIIMLPSFKLQREGRLPEVNCSKKLSITFSSCCNINSMRITVISSHTGLIFHMAALHTGGNCR